MALSFTLDSVVKAADGRVRFRSGGREREFASLADAAEFARGMLTPEVLEAFIVAMVLTRQPALGNPAIFANKTLAVDLTAPANIMTVS